MKDPTKSKNKVDLDQNRESKYSNNQYNFEKIFNILILDQIFQFIEKDGIKCLSWCSKKIYQFYCKQVKKLKIKRNIVESNISNIKFDKYVNLIELDLEECENIKDYSFISKLEKLEKLNLCDTNISDISFLENNKNIKELDLAWGKNIKDYSIISKLEKNQKI